MYSMLRNLLFRLPPEQAHNVALSSLDLGLEDIVMESLDLEDLEQEPDADHAMELARDREMGL